MVNSSVFEDAAFSAPLHKVVGPVKSSFGYHLIEVLDKQPFDGPLFVRFGYSTHVLGGALARAMRVAVSR